MCVLFILSTFGSSQIIQVLEYVKLGGYMAWLVFFSNLVMNISALRYLADYLSFDDGEILFADVTQRQNSTTANRKISFVMVQNHEMPIVHFN